MPDASPPPALRPVWFAADGTTDTPTYNRTALHHGHARVDARRNVRIER